MTNKGTLIRTPVKTIRLTGRNAKGVIVFKTADDEHIVSATRIQSIEGDLPEGAEGAENNNN